MAFSPPSPDTLVPESGGFTPPPPDSLVEEPSTFLERQAPLKALAREATTGVGALAQGTAAAALMPTGEVFTPDPFKPDQRMPKRVKFMRGGLMTVAPEEPTADTMKQIQESKLYQWGQAVKEGAKEAYEISPTEEQGILTKIGAALGGFLPFMATGPLAPATINLQTVGDTLDRTYQEELGKGKDHDEAAKAAVDHAMASGAAQTAIFALLPGPLRKLGDAALDKLSANVLTRFLAKRAAGAATGAALGGTSAATQAAMEGKPVLPAAAEGAAGLALGMGLMPYGRTAQEEALLGAPRATTDPRAAAWAATFGAGGEPAETAIRRPQAVVRPTQPFVPPEPGPMRPILTPHQEELQQQVETLQRLIVTEQNPLALRGLYQKLAMVRAEFEGEKGKEYAPGIRQQRAGEGTQLPRVETRPPVPPDVTQVRPGEGAQTDGGDRPVQGPPLQAPAPPPDVAPPVAPPPLAPPPPERPELPAAPPPEISDELRRRMLGPPKDATPEEVAKALQDRLVKLVHDSDGQSMQAGGTWFEGVVDHEKDEATISARGIRVTAKVSDILAGKTDFDTKGVTPPAAPSGPPAEEPVPGVTPTVTTHKVEDLGLGGGKKWRAIAQHPGNDQGGFLSVEGWGNTPQEAGQDARNAFHKAWKARAAKPPELPKPPAAPEPEPPPDVKPPTAPPPAPPPAPKVETATVRNVVGFKRDGKWYWQSSGKLMREPGLIAEYEAALTGKAPAPPVDEEIRSIIYSADDGPTKARRIKDLAGKRGRTLKEMQEDVEAEIVKATDRLAREPDMTDRQRFERIVGLYARQPVMSARTSTSMADQAYSTPSPLSFALKHATGTDENTSVYEPTAGNAMLMIGSNLDTSHGNEINTERQKNLRRFGVKTVTGHDATQFSPTGKFDSVKANPPFGSIDNVNYGGYGIRRLEHIISLRALEAMKDNGTAALILGAKREPGEQGKGAQWVFENYLYGHYNVVDNFEVAGDLYARQGASWPVRVIIIDGRRAKPIGGELAPKSVDRLNSWDDVWNRAERLRNELDQRRQALGAGGTPGVPLHPPGPTAPAPQPGPIPPTPAGTPGAPGEAGQPGGAGGGKPEAGRPPAGIPDVPPGGVPGPGPAPLPPTQLPPPGEPTGGLEGGGAGGAKTPADAGPAGTGAGPGTKPGVLPGPPTLDRPAGDITGLSDSDLDNLLDDVFAPPAPAPKPAPAPPGPPRGPRGPRPPKGPAEPPPPPKTKTAADIAAEAAKAGVKGAGEALKGLHELFGGGELMGSGFAFNEQTYARAKPHFKEAYEQFKKAGRSIKEFFQFVAQNMGETARPYLKRFIQDLQAEEREPSDKKLPGPEVKDTEFQTAYAPRSKGEPMGTLTPKNLAEATFKALDKIEAEVGPIDDFVANRLHLQPDEVRDVVGAEQIDGIAQAIYQIEKGGELIIGDEAGIGKGRQGAGVIRYAKFNGKIPIFFTADPKLFSDMYGDLQAIHTTVKPLIFGDSFAASIVDVDGNRLVQAPGLEVQKREMERIVRDGWEKSGYDSIFITYSQVNDRNARQQFLEHLAENNPTVVIMDESHKAAGESRTSMSAAFFSGGLIQRGSGANLQNIRLPGLLLRAGTRRESGGGVLALSATWAKRPENMAAYFRTSLSQAAQSFTQIVTAMKRGGVALQQAVSEALAQVGQYVRRERDFSGVDYAMKRVSPKNAEQLVEHVDQITDVLSEIVGFSRDIRQAVAGSTAMTQTQMDMTDFASVVHNQISQLLLAAKADAVVEECLAAKAKGEKPVVVVMNTMSSFLDGYAEDHNIAVGQPIQARWHELLKYALSRTLRVTETLPNGDTEIHYADPDEFGMKERYDAIVEAAEGIESNFPISPIDYIIQKLEQAGVKMAELTGRQTGIHYTDFEKGEGAYRSFPKAKKNEVVNGFNRGDYDGMLLNEAGSTGLSAHASEKVADQRPRHMIIAQPAADINVFIQTLGRIRRTGMVLLGMHRTAEFPERYFGQSERYVGTQAYGGRPYVGMAIKERPYGARYTHLVLPLQAELRPAAMAARKMKSLNANTTSETDAAVKIDSEDIFNKYGDAIVREYLDQNPELQRITRLPIGINDSGELASEPDVARKFTGRIALLPDAEQKTAYEHILPAYREKLEQLKATGAYDLEIVVHNDWDAVRQSDTELAPGTDESNLFTSSVRMQQWEIKDNRHVPTGPEMVREFEHRTGGARKVQSDWQAVVLRTDRSIEERKRRLTEEAASDNPTLAMVAQMQLVRLEELEKRWNDDTKPMVSQILRHAGQIVEMNNQADGTGFHGMMVDVKMPSAGLRVAPSNFKFKFAIDAPGGVVYLTGQEVIGGHWTTDRSTRTLKDLTGRSQGSRYSRYFVVGNPIRADSATAGRGKIVRFKTRENQIVTGLLMPPNWGPQNLAQDPRVELTSGAAAHHFLVNFGEPSWRKMIPIEAGGIVRIQKQPGADRTFVVSTSAARRTGGKIFLDEELRNITGDFVKAGSQMRVEVEGRDLPSVIDRIMEITQARFKAVGDPDALIPQVAISNRRGAEGGTTRQALVTGAPVGTEVGGARKNPDGRWYKVGPDGTTSGPPASPRREAQFEIAAKGVPITHEAAVKLTKELLGSHPENVKLVNEPGEDWAGRVLSIHGKLPAVELNLANIHAPEQFRQSLIEEMVHSVWDHPSVFEHAKALEAMVTKGALELKAQEGYRPEVRREEAAVALVRKLYADHEESGLFRRAVNQVVLAVKRFFGMDLTPEQAALHIVNRALKNQPVHNILGKIPEELLPERLLPKERFALARTPQEYERQKTFGEAAAAVRAVGAHSELARMKTEASDELDLSPRARALIGQQRSEGMHNLAIGEANSIENYQQARDWARSQSPYIQRNVTIDALHSLGHEQARSEHLKREYQKRLARIQSPGFIRQVSTLLKRETIADIQTKKDDTFRNIISVKVQKLLNDINRSGIEDARSEQLRQSLERTKKLTDWTAGVAQKMEAIVSKIYPDYWKIGRASKSGKEYMELYEAMRRQEGNPITDTQERALLNIAAEVLGINSAIGDQLYWMEKTRREPDFGPLIESTSKAFAARLEKDPGKAVAELMRKTAKQATRAEEARQAFVSLQSKLLRQLTDFNDHEKAVLADERIKNSAEWKALVNAVNQDVGAHNIPANQRDSILKGGYNTFTGDISEIDPFGVVHKITLGFTNEDALKAQEKLETYLAQIDKWLYDPANETHTDASFWQAKRDFIDSVYNTMGVLNPGSVKSFGTKFFRKTWDMPQFLFQQAKLPVMKVLQTAFENWHRVLVVGAQWSQGTIAPLMHRVIDAMKSHGMDANLGVEQYREQIFNSLAWAYRHNKALKAGDKVFGQTLTEADITLLKRMGGSMVDIMTKAKNLGAAKVMPGEMLFDKFAANAFAIRKPAEMGAEPGTTVPREISQTRGKDLATAMARAGTVDRQVAILNEYFEPFVLRWLGERSWEYSKETPFEPLFKEIVDMVNRGDPEAPRSVEEVLDYINHNTDSEYTPEQIAGIVVGGMADETARMYKNFYKPDAVDRDSQVRVIRASRETPFTTAFEKDLGCSFWYDYGMLNAGEVRSTALDSTMWHLQRLDMAMTAAEKSLGDALMKYRAMEGRPLARRAYLEKQRKGYLSGDDFRDFEDLQSQLNELRSFHDRLPVWTGQSVVKYEGLTTLQRLVTDNVLQTLSGVMTVARVFTGSAIKQGLVLSAFERFAPLAYAKSAVSMAMSLTRIGLVGPAQFAARRVGLMAPLKEEMSGWAEELFRSMRFFDQQYAYGLGFKNPTLDIVSNNLRMPVTHGGGYNANLSENRGVALLQRGAFRALSAAEAPIEFLKTIFPTLGYAVAYDSVARQTYWEIRSLESRLRRTFDTYEKTGQLGRFDLDRPKALQNRLMPQEVLKDGILPATETQLSLAREFFRRGTDVDLNDATMYFWRKLRDTPKERRGEVHLLSADAATPEAAAKLETARAGALASIGLFDIHHASPANRPWILRSNWFGRLAWPIAGWSLQSTRQWFALMGKAAADPRLRQWALTTLSVVGILGTLGIQCLDGDLEKRIFSWLKWLAFNEVDPIKHLGEGRDAKEEAQIAISNTFSYIPALNNLIDMALAERSNRTAAINDIFLVDKVKSLMNYVNGVAHTGDPLYGLANFARRDAPWLRPIVNRTPGQEGLTEERNVRTAIQKAAPEELIRQTTGGYGMPTPTELTPIKEQLANAIYKGDSEGVRDAYYALIAQATKMGKADPERLAQQVLRSLNPYSLALASHPTDQQRSELLGRLSDREKQVLLNGETNFLAATQMLGVGSEMVKQDRAEKGQNVRESTPSSRGTISPRVSLGGSRLPVLGRPRARGGRISIGSRRLGGGLRARRRVSYVSGRLSPRRRSVRVSSPRLRSRRRRLTLA